MRGTCPGTICYKTGPWRDPEHRTSTPSEGVRPAIRSRRSTCARLAVYILLTWASSLYITFIVRLRFILHTAPPALCTRTTFQTSNQ